MAEKVPVPVVVTEKTYVGRVAFPATVPERLVEWLRFPDDVFACAPAMGLDRAAVDFVLAVLHGKWGLQADVDLPALAIRTGWKFPDMDRIVCDLIKKNYARLGDRLDLYRFWIVLLHVKGTRFVPGGNEEG
jgi:hypothetical protein